MIRRKFWGPGAGGSGGRGGVVLGRPARVGLGSSIIHDIRMQTPDNITRNENGLAAPVKQGTARSSAVCKTVEKG